MKTLNTKETGFHFPGTLMVKNGNRFRISLFGALLVVVMLACSGDILFAKESELKGYFLIDGKWKKGTLKGDGITIDGDIATAEPPCTLTADDGSYIHYKEVEPIVVGYKPSGTSIVDMESWIVNTPWFPSGQIINIRCMMENWSTAASFMGFNFNLTITDRELLEKQLLVLTLLNLADTTGRFNDYGILAFFVALHSETCYIPDDIWDDFIALIPTDKMRDSLSYLYANDPGYQICGLPCCANPAALLDLIPISDLQAVFEEKLQMEPCFQSVFNMSQQSEEIAVMLEVLRYIPEYQDCIYNSNLQSNEELIDAIIDAANPNYHKLSNSLETQGNNFISNISIYPNPTDDKHATLSFNANIENNIQITLCDITGAELMEIYNGFVTANNFMKTFSLESFSAGTYYIKIVNNNNVQVEKIIVR